MKSLGLSFCAALLLALLAVAPAKAGMITYNFTGTCTDCAGTVSGQLTLQNYTQGTQIVTGNSDFVSFAYGGSNLLAAYTMSDADTVFFDIDIPVNLPSTGAVFINDQTIGMQFESAFNGSWCTGGGCTSDRGRIHNWDVPEPASLAILGTGLALLGATRRKRRQSR